MITLTFDETYTLLYQAKKRKVKRFGFQTKYKWQCLHCLTTIYISYKQYGRHCIFCDSCRTKANQETIVQYQYMRVLKDRQIQMIEKMLNKNLDTVASINSEVTTNND